MVQKYKKSNISWYIEGWLPRGISIIEENKNGIKNIKTMMLPKDNKDINKNIVKNMKVIVEGEPSNIKWFEEFLSKK